MLKLRSCPFCGGEAEYIPMAKDATGVISATVRCRECACGTRVLYPDDAVRAWNRRVKALVRAGE